jgi:hypothetical protein
MALQLTTTSALSTLAGAQGDLYLNTTNNKLIVFHTAGTGNYDEFTDDGTLGASIELTFNDGGSSDYWSSNTSSGMFYQYFSGADVSGHYKRMDDPAAFQTEVTGASNMSGASLPGGGYSGIPGETYNTSYSQPFIYQSDMANAIQSGPGTKPLAFVYTGSTQGGTAVSRSVAWDDGMGNTGTYYYVPFLFMVNEGTSGMTQAPFWCLDFFVKENSSTINTTYTSTSNTDFSLLKWGDGYVTAGNNEDTVRQSLVSSSSSYIYALNVASSTTNWTVSQTYYT